jgi:hypothetical protein
MAIILSRNKALVRTRAACPNQLDPRNKYYNCTKTNYLRQPKTAAIQPILLNRSNARESPTCAHAAPASAICLSYDALRPTFQPRRPRVRCFAKCTTSIPLPRLLDASAKNANLSHITGPSGRVKKNFDKCIHCKSWMGGRYAETRKRDERIFILYPQSSVRLRSPQATLSSRLSHPLPPG